MNSPALPRKPTSLLFGRIHTLDLSQAGQVISTSLKHFIMSGEFMSLVEFIK